MNTDPSRVRKSVRSACEEDQTSAIVGLLGSASEPDSSIDIKDLKHYISHQAVLCRARKILIYLVKRGINFEAISVHTILPAGLDEPEPKLTTIEWLEFLLTLGWDINAIDYSTAYCSFGPPYRGTFPFLWSVCHSPSLVKWSLQHQASLMIPGQTTSLDPYQADVFHTAREALLLEKAAFHGDISTFEILRSAGAPLTPGLSWPSIQAPHILVQAVLSATLLAPKLKEPPSAKYLARVDMVCHLLDVVRLEVDGGRPTERPVLLWSTDWHTRRQVFMEHRLNEKDVRLLVDKLLDHGAELSYISQHRTYLVYRTPLDLVAYIHRAGFTRAVNEWQDRRKLESSPKPQKDMLVSSTRPQVHYLLKCPMEILDRIGSYLLLPGIQNLRLASRSTLHTFQWTFQRAIRKRKIILKPSHLRKYIREINTNSLLCFMEIADIRGASGVQSLGHRRVPNLLEQLFKVAQAKGRLRSLDMQLGTADELAHVLHASCATALKPQILNFCYREHGCNVSKNRCINLQKLCSLLDKTKEFDLEIDMKSTPETMNATGGLDYSNKSGLVYLQDILTAAQSTEILRLPWSGPGSSTSFLNQCSQSISAMPRLKSCSLIDFKIEEGMFLEFLKQIKATRLELKNITLLSGTFKAIFTTLTNGSFDYYRLNDLYEMDLVYGVRRVAFRTPFFDLYRPDGFPLEILRQGRETSRELLYDVSRPEWD